MCLDSANAKVLFISKSELMQQADLVVSGKVIKLELNKQAERTPDEFSDSHFFRVMCATIQIEKTIKGNIDGQYVIVEFIDMDPNREADVQDAQFGMGSKGTAYLKKLSNNHYKALGGWTNGWTK